MDFKADGLITATSFSLIIIMIITIYFTTYNIMKESFNVQNEKHSDLFS